MYSKMETITGKHNQLPGLIHNMLTSGTKTKSVTWLITTFSDAILEKVIEFAQTLGKSERFAEAVSEWRHGREKDRW